MTKKMIITSTDKILAVMEHRSISRAAKALNLSQSSLSRAVQEFESELNTSLFVRTPDGVEITDAGRLCADYLLQLKEAEEDLRKGLNFLRSSFFTVNIALPLHVSSAAILEIEKKVHDRYPDAELHITNVFSGKVPPGLLSDKYDFAISWRDGEGDPRLSFEPFYDDHFLLLVPKSIQIKSHQLVMEGRNVSTVDIQDIALLPFVLQNEGTSVRGTIDQFCEKYGLTLDNRLSVANSMVAINAVKRGIGCAFVMEAYSPFFRDSEDFSVYFMPEDVEETIGLLKLARKDLSSVELYVADVIRSYLLERRRNYHIGSPGGEG
ncbi:MAG: LysR family transcriptional regulator [Solobacterium sp.]|nr:LysR family transcriptional regulator [Solobacterium sp.]